VKAGNGIEEATAEVVEVIAQGKRLWGARHCSLSTAIDTLMRAK
jgi:hypothetical protein